MGAACNIDNLQKRNRPSKEAQRLKMESSNKRLFHTKKRGKIKIESVTFQLLTPLHTSLK
jgi:hypothetical protein